jgi:hypothetical protein
MRCEVTTTHLWKKKKNGSKALLDAQMRMENEFEEDRKNMSLTIWINGRMEVYLDFKSW